MKKTVQISIAILLILSMLLVSIGCPSAEQIQGPAGPQGAQGPPGPQGEQGATGSQGDPGTMAATGELTITIPGYGLSDPGKIVVEVNHGLGAIALPPCVYLGLVTEYGIIIGNDFIFGFQTYLEEVIAGQSGALPKVAFTVYDVTPVSFKVAAICTEGQPTAVTIRWWAVPAQ